LDCYSGPKGLGKESGCIFVTALALAAVVQVQMAPAEVQTSLADISVFSPNFAFE